MQDEVSIIKKNDYYIWMQWEDCQDIDIRYYLDVVFIFISIYIFLINWNVT